ncbi:Thioredoxin domain-containing protein, partial [Cephalotus follicularis]
TILRSRARNTLTEHHPLFIFRFRSHKKKKDKKKSKSKSKLSTILCFAITVSYDPVLPMATTTTIIEPLSLTRFSALPSINNRGALRLPEFRGLKIRPSLKTARCFQSLSLSQTPSSRLARRSRFVCEAQETAVEVPAVTDAKWQSVVLESELPVLVEFWAPWCGPCRMIHPVIDELAKQYVGKLKCYKVNTDESPSIATQYGIRSIPTVIIFKNGEKKDAVIGAVPKSTLTTSIEKYL